MYLVDFGIFILADPEYDDERDEETPRWVRIAKQPPDVRKLEDIVFLAKQLKRYCRFVRNYHVQC
jgi:hypothetical protein